MFSPLKNLISKKAIILSLFLTLFFAASALAQNVVPWNNGTFENPSTLNSVETVTAAITNWILGIAAGIVILFLIIGGLYYITAAGDEKQMGEGKKIVNYAVIGLIVILISYSLVKTLSSIIFG